MITVQQANAANLHRFYGRTPPYTLTGLVYFDGDEHTGVPVAVAGVYRASGYRIVFSDLKPEARKYRKTIFKTARDFVRSLDYTVHAIVDENEPTSAAFLLRLGFKLVEGNPGICVREV